MPRRWPPTVMMFGQPPSAQSSMTVCNPFSMES
jgi:hypothetical protein